MNQFYRSMAGFDGVGVRGQLDLKDAIRQGLKARVILW
jgi:hypothetical protein